MDARKNRKFGRFAVLALVVGAIASPLAPAQTDGTLLSKASQQAAQGHGTDATALAPSGSYIGHPGGPGAGGPVLPQRLRVGEGFSLGVPPQYLADSSQNQPAKARLREGFSLGVPPEYVADTELVATTRAEGFDWADASIGAGFAAGVSIFAAGALLIVRRRQALAQLHS
jgi:hypothetical protein